jgi:3-oxoacyl-[acyl-carrier-protein] synthase-3
VKLGRAMGLRAVTSWLPDTVESAAQALADGRITAQDAEANGYRQLPVSAGIAPPEMAVLAATDALKRSSVDAVDLVIHAWTYYQGHDFWSPAHYIANEIGAYDAMPFGIQQMCNGAGIALEIAAARLLADPAAGSALVTTADRFAEPGFDRWRGDYGLWYGDGATAAVLARDAEPTDDLHLLAIASTAVPWVESMHRGRDEFSLAPRGVVDIRRTKKAFLEEQGKDAFAAVVAERLPALIRTALDEAGVTDPELVALPRLGRAALDAAYAPAVGGVPTLDLGRDTGHLGAGDLLANLAALVDSGALAPGRTAVALSAGGGFSWSCAVVRRPTQERLSE